jgi:hypothetical protein
LDVTYNIRINIYQLFIRVTAFVKIKTTPFRQFIGDSGEIGRLFRFRIIRGHNTDYLSQWQNKPVRRLG